MRDHSEKALMDYTYTQNRELSWLRFNKRVLEEAADPLVPGLERLNFIAIFTSNLDEFFMVRVGSLVDLAALSPNEIDSKSGLDPAQQLQAIYETIPGLVETKQQIFQEVSGVLEKEGVQDLEYDQMTPEEEKFAADYFQSAVLPILSPQIVGLRHPSPHLENKALYVAALLKKKSKEEKKGEKRTKESCLGLIPVPPSLPPLVMLPGPGHRFLRMETILRHWAPTLFGKYRVEETCVIAATRNADLSFDMDKYEDSEGDLRGRMTKLLKKRAHQAVVRLEINQRPSQAMMDLLRGIITVEDHQVFYDPCPLDMHYVRALTKALSQELRKALTYRPYTSRWPEDLNRSASMIDQIRRKDRLLFFPFDSIDPFLRLLEEAAERSVKKQPLAMRVVSEGL